MKIDFQEKFAIVTGGEGCIVAACVHELLEPGAIVEVVDVSEEALRKLKEKTVSYMEAGKVGYYRMDITDIGEIKKIVTKIRKELGEIKVLIQSAGLMRSKSGLQMTPEEWDLMFQINTRGLFFMMQQVVAQSMRNEGGAIVNFSSMAGIRGMREGMESAHYSDSKGAVVAMTRQAATEWAKYGVRCNAVAPGGVRTEKMKTMEFTDTEMQPVPLGRLSEPEEIAYGVVFLVSEQAEMITGQTLVIDGGSSIVGY